MTQSPVDRVPVHAERVVLVGGHESSQAAGLGRFRDAAADWVTTPAGRSLASTVESALAVGQSVTVVPMTFGRDPVLIAETAKTLRWIRDRQGGQTRLAAPFGSTDHLIAHLRAAVIRLQRVSPGAALVIAAGASDNFNDAELHRVAHLVRAESSAPEVTVALLRVGRDTLPDAADRLRRLGYEHSGVVPAGFHDSMHLPQTDGHSMIWCGPLMRDNAVARIIAERVAGAHHAWAHGHDGIDPALDADHDHGYAHSHNDVADHDHGHGHGHGHSHRPSSAGKERHGFSQTAV